MRILLVFIGGAIGGLTRYLLEWAIPIHDSFPFGTLAINMSGSLAIGLLYGLIKTRRWPNWIRLCWGVGFTGAFTTFSTFSLETLHLFSHSFAFGLLYAFGSLIGGPALAVTGVEFAIAASRHERTPGTEEIYL